MRVPQHGTVVVHDRYVNYDHFDGIRHQLCTRPHPQGYRGRRPVLPDAIRPGQIARELRALIHQANRARGAGLPAVPADATTGHLRLFRHGVNAGLSQVRRVLKCWEADGLRFLSDTGIPPTSNQAERDLRPAKTQQKISGRLRSENTTRNRYAIRGYASTAAKHGHPVFTAIRDALAANPWMSPIPGTA